MTATSTAGAPSQLSYAGGYAALDATATVKAVAAGADFFAGVRRYRSSRYLAVETMKNLYRRTVLGPWWVTLQSALYVAGLAAIFGQLLHSSTKEFLPYVTSGYLYFVLLLGVIRAAAMVFISASSVIMSTRQPLTGLVLRDVTVEFLQFGHNAIILLVLYPLGLLDPHWTVLLIPVVLAVTALNAVALALWLGPFVARYRDVGPAVMSVLQVIIFFTPVFYKSRGLTGAAEAVVRLNPLSYFIECFRPLLLGSIPTATNLLTLAGVTAANVILGAVVFSATRSRIPYWVA